MSAPKGNQYGAKTKKFDKSYVLGCYRTEFNAWQKAVLIEGYKSLNAMIRALCNQAANHTEAPAKPAPKKPVIIGKWYGQRTIAKNVCSDGRARK